MGVGDCTPWVERRRFQEVGHRTWGLCVCLCNTQKKTHRLQQMPGLTLGEWGPGAWNTLHVFSHSAPKELTNEEMKKFGWFLNTFAEYLPCPKCRRHFQGFLDRRMTDDSLRTRSSIVKLLNDAHNEVNARTGKRIYTLEEHYRVYSFKPRHTTNTLLRDISVVVVVAIVVARLTLRTNVHV